MGTPGLESYVHKFNLELDPKYDEYLNKHDKISFESFVNS